MKQKSTALSLLGGTNSADMKDRKNINKGEKGQTKRMRRAGMREEIIQDYHPNLQLGVFLP